jgi:hypothetical protein
MIHAISFEEESLIEYRRTQCLQILRKEIQLEHSRKVRNALDLVAQKLRITLEAESAT